MQGNTAESKYLRYVVGQKNPFNAWWSVEKILFPTKRENLQRGDSVIINNSKCAIVALDGSSAIVESDDETRRQMTVSLPETITVVATRSEIGAHGERLNYKGAEEVFER